RPSPRRKTKRAARSVISAGCTVGRALSARRVRGTVSGRRGGERRAPGDLRHRLPARLPERPSPRTPGRGPWARDCRGLDRARAGLERAAAYRPNANACGRRRTRAVGVSWSRHARRRALRRALLLTEDPPVSYTLRGRVESRLAA